MNTPVYANKICHKLLDDNIRDLILKGELKSDDFGNDDVFNLLMLLKNERHEDRPHFTDIILAEWNHVVKNSNFTAHH